MLNLPEKLDCRYMNLKRVSIGSEIFIRRDLSDFSPQLNLPCRHKLSLECRSGLKLNPDARKQLLKVKHVVLIASSTNLGINKQVIHNTRQNNNNNNNNNNLHL